MESYETQIQRSIDYIEEDVMEKQTLRNLARVAGFSEVAFSSCIPGVSRRYSNGVCSKEEVSPGSLSTFSYG